MKKYRILVHGKDFNIKIKEGGLLKGFYGTRFIEAKNEKQAEHKAVELIRKNKYLRANTPLRIKLHPPGFMLRKL
ncbi:MAG: hypothetical protein E2O78_06590 [Caldithrix sp.]|nr:MAG: hypothetical protein E2O78_06590 [Caldithrix sp.]